MLLVNPLVIGGQLGQQGNGAGNGGAARVREPATKDNYDRVLDRLPVNLCGEPVFPPVGGHLQPDETGHGGGIGFQGERDLMRDVLGGD